MNRRDLLKVVAGGASPMLWSVRSASGQACAAKEGTVRDRFWLFGCPANTDLPYLGQRSLMSPAEGAYYMGIPNLIMVNTGGDEAKYGHWEPPYDQYAIALRPFRRVAWSIVGTTGATTTEERRLGIELAKETPNFVAVMMDDFFTDEKEGKLAVLTLDELREIQEQLKAGGKKLDLFVTLYTSQLDNALGEYLKLIDVVTLWTWKPAELVNLEANLRKLERLAPHTRKMLGCYWVDYNTKGRIPLASMKLQCGTGLRWLRQGRIEGLAFLGNTHEDLGYEAVEWTRKWIEQVGNRKV